MIEKLKTRLEALAVGCGGMSQITHAVLSDAAKGLANNGGIIFEEAGEKKINETLEGLLKEYFEE